MPQPWLFPRIFHILLCSRLKTAKIDRLWFATFIYFNKMPGVQWVYLSLTSQKVAEDAGFWTHCDLETRLFTKSVGYHRGFCSQNLVSRPFSLRTATQKPGFLPNLSAITKGFASKTGFLCPLDSRHCDSETGLLTKSVGYHRWFCWQNPVSRP